MTGSFRELKVYQMSFDAARQISLISMKFPKEETYSLTDQIRRSSRSVSANIGEGYRKRIYPKHFSSKMSDADGECTETMIWLDYAKECGYLSPENHLKTKSMCDEIGRMLGRMINNPEKFTPKKQLT